MEVSDAGVFNRMHDAKTEFNYQLFKAEHKSFYDDKTCTSWTIAEQYQTWVG